MNNIRLPNEQNVRAKEIADPDSGTALLTFNVLSDIDGNPLNLADQATAEAILARLQAVLSVGLPTGASTASKQDAAIALLNGIGSLLSGHITVDVASLPSGLASASLQTTLNGIVATAAKQDAAQTVLQAISTTLANASTAAAQAAGNALLTAIAASVAAPPALPTGAATAALQGTGNVSLATLATASAAAATAALQTAGNAKLDAIVSALSTPATGGATETTLAAILAATATAANQSTLNTSVASIDSKLTNQATAAKQDTLNTSAASIDTKLTSQATSAKQDTLLAAVSTSAKQDTGNAALASLVTALTNQATAANQATQQTTLASIDSKLTSQATSAKQDTLLAAVATAVKQDVIAGKQDTGNAALANIVTALTNQATATLQTAANTKLDSVNAVLGAPADASATSDGGTFSLTALVKRLLAKFPLTLGSALMAASFPVAIASDQILPVSGTVVSASGTISAVNANPFIGTPTANSYVEMALNGAGSIYIGVVPGAWVGSVTLYVTVDGVNWIANSHTNALFVPRTNVSTPLISPGEQLWMAGNLAGILRVRIAATSYTSGAPFFTMRGVAGVANPTAIQNGFSAIGSVSITSISNGASLIGDVGIGVRAGNTNTAVQFKILSLATTNANLVKSSAGKRTHLSLTNKATTVRYIKFYNSSVLPTVGTTPVIATFPIAANGGFLDLAWGDAPVGHSAGIAFAITTSDSESDATAIGAGEVFGELHYA